MSRSERSDLMLSAPTTTFHLKYSAQPNDSNEILTLLRLILDPSVKLYLLPKDNDIVLRALPDDVAIARKLIEESDRPRKTFRLTYTLVEMDGTKRLSAQHYTLMATSGQRATLKEGNKVPVATGKYDDGAERTETQMTYLDVGLNFDATMTDVAGGAEVKSKVERSAVGDEKPTPGLMPDPVVHQTVLDSAMFLPLGKSVAIGAIDIPNTTRRLEIEAMVETVP